MYKMPTFTFINSVSRAYLKLLNKTWSTAVKELSLTSSVFNTKSEMEELSLKMPWGEISGKEFGSENKDKVLCLHGWLDNCNTFDRLVQHLPKDKHYVLIDFPGHGKSSHYHKGTYYSWIQYVDVLERVRRRLKWNTFSILAHSLGANMGTVYSSVFAEKVERLIIIDTLGIHPYPMRITSEVLRKSIEGYQDYEESDKKEKQYTYEDAKRRLMKGNEDLSEEAAEVLLKRGLKKVENADKFTYSRDFRQTIPNPHHLSPEHFEAIVTRIKADTLRIDALDGYIRKYAWEEYKEKHIEFVKSYRNCNHYEEHWVEGNHHVHLNHPDKIQKIVHDFLLRPKRDMNT